MTGKSQLTIALTALALATLPAPAGAPAPQQLTGPPTLVSTNVDGTATGNDGAELDDRGLTPDGRFLVLENESSDFIDFPDANGNSEDIFRKDLQTGAVVPVSVNAAGTATGNDSSFNSSMSADGRFVAFESLATDLVTGVTDTNNTNDVFVRDLDVGTTTLVSFNSAGTAIGLRSSTFPQISADGRFVFFLNNRALDIAGVADGNGMGGQELFVRDLEAETTELVNINAGGTASSDQEIHEGEYSISADGRVVAFGSRANDLVANDSNNAPDIYARDLDAGVTTLVSVAVGGMSSPSLERSEEPVISGNGRYVAFLSNADDLVAVPIGGPAFSRNVFVRDLQENSTALVSINSPGTASGNDDSRSVEAITPNGRFVLFKSNATDLVSGVTDTNGGPDLFVRDMVEGVTTLVSYDSTGTATGNEGMDSGRITPDGRFVVFESGASNYVTGIRDGNSLDNIFLRDLETGVTTVLNLTFDGTATGNNDADNPLISDDGMIVAFDSDATDHVDLPDANGTNEDVFVVGPVDLSLSKSASESVVTHSDTITYSLSVTNNSMFDAHGVVVTDDLPGNTSVVSAPGCLAAGGDVTCAAGTLRSGESASFAIRVRVGGNAINDLTNRATVTSSSFEVKLGNNSAQTTTRLEGRTQLSLSQFISPNPLVAGQPATKRISVTAVGPGAATGVVLTDPLPAGLTFVSAPPGCVFAAGTVTCTPGTLLVNQRALYEIQVMVDADASGSITNVVTATADQADEPAVSSRTVPVNVGGLPIPTPLTNGVVDTADFIPFGEPGHAMAPKSLVSIFGSGFIPEGSFSASTIPLPTMLGGVMVTFDGIKAPLLLVRPDLIICQLPMGVTLPSATMVIDNGGFGKAASEPQEIQIAEHSPGIFTLSQDGNGQAIVVHAGTADLAAPVGTVGNSRPAGEGDNLTIYVNGLGPVDPPIADGANSCDPDGICLPDGSNVVLHRTLTTPIIRIGGVEVPERNVLFSGSSPASVGVNEVVFTVPAGLPSGDAISLTIEIGGVISKETSMAVE